MLAYQLNYNESVIAAGSPFNTEAASYLDEKFKGCVTASLEDLLRERPEDPIDFLARRIKEKKKEADLLIAQQLAEAARKAEESTKFNKRKAASLANSLVGASFATAEKTPSVDEQVEEETSNAVQTEDGYLLRFPGGVDCHIKSLQNAPVESIPGVNVKRMLFPSVYEIDTTLRVLEASSPLRDGEAPPIILIIEQPRAPAQGVFISGIPYLFNLIEQLQREVRSKNEDAPRPSNGESFEEVALTLLQSYLGNDTVYLETGIRELVKRKNDEGSNVHVCVLPSLQTDYLHTYDRIDEVFFEIMHPDLITCIRRGKHYSQPPSSSEIPFTEPPSVLFVSYSKSSASLTYARILETFFPYYERQQSIEMDGLREKNAAIKAKFSMEYCQTYWANVHRGREERDEQRANKKANNKKKNASSSQANSAMASGRSLNRSVEALRVASPENVERKKQILEERTQRREREDANYLQVIKAHKHYAAGRIQCLFKGFLVRKKFNLKRTVPAPSVTLWDATIPFSVPPLLRLCASRVSKVHGELFGNYTSTLLPQPRKIVLYKPVRTVFRNDDDDDASEKEDWATETILIPPKRSSSKPVHFNPLQRLFEYQRMAECPVLETAMRMQKQWGGLSVLQRKAYDMLKSLTLSILHIAYLELFHRDRLPLESMRFSSFVRNYHSVVCGWLSYPHLLSQSSLLSIFRTFPEQVPASEKALLNAVERFTLSTRRKERILLLESNVDYLNASSEAAKQSLKVKCLGKKLFAVPRLLSTVEWQVAVEFMKDSVSINQLQFIDPEPIRIYWWCLSESPCVLVHGRAFALRPRRNIDVIPGLEAYDEYCSREVCSNAVAEADVKPAQAESPSAHSAGEGSDGTVGKTVAQVQKSLGTIFDNFSILDEEADLKQQLTTELTETGVLSFFVKSGASMYARQTMNYAELSAEKYQQDCNAKKSRECKTVKCESGTASYVSSENGSFSGDSSIEKENNNFSLSDEAFSSSSDASDSPEVLTVEEAARSLHCQGDTLQLIRPRLMFTAQDEFVTRFNAMIDACLQQIKEEAIMVLNYTDESHLFYCVVATLLSRSYDSANPSERIDPEDVAGVSIGSHSQAEGLLSADNVRLAFLDEVYEILKSAMFQNGVDVDDCVTVVTSIMAEFEPYNLLKIISTEVMLAESEPNDKCCRKHILSAVRHSEHFVWLLLVQAYLSLPFTRDSLSKSSVNSIPSFVSFFKSVGVKQWMDVIDPWKLRRHQSPDVFHLRYSNSLRRWDSDHYIRFGSIIDQDLE